MAKKDKDEDQHTTQMPALRPASAALVLHGRELDLNVAGSRNMQVSIDPVELGVNEIALDLPGIKLRIEL